MAVDVQEVVGSDPGKVQPPVRLLGLQTQGRALDYGCSRSKITTRHDSRSNREVELGGRVVPSIRIAAPQLESDIYAIRSARYIARCDFEPK